MSSWGRVAQTKTDGFAVDTNGFGTVVTVWKSIRFVLDLDFIAVLVIPLC